MPKLYLPARLSVIFFFTSYIALFSVQAFEFRSGETLNLRGQFSDNLFATGGNIQVELVSTDDVYIAGKDVAFSATIEQDLFLGGGAIVVSTSQAQLAAVGGGTLAIFQSNFRELLVGGGNIRLDGNQIHDDLVIKGAEIYVGETNKVNGSTAIEGGTVVLAGIFNGDVRVEATQLRLEPSVIMNGNLIHKSQSYYQDPGAQIKGKVTAEPTEKDDEGFTFTDVLIGLLFIFGFFLVLPLVAIVFPVIVSEGERQIRTHFWANLGKGVLVALLAPVVVFLLMISFIGAPLGVTVIPFLLVALILAWTIAVYSIGDQMRMWIRKEDNAVALSVKDQFGWTFLGAVVLGIFTVIPFLGIVIYLIALFSGLGSLYVSFKKHVSSK